MQLSEEGPERFFSFVAPLLDERRLMAREVRVGDIRGKGSPAQFAALHAAGTVQPPNLLDQLPVDCSGMLSEGCSTRAFVAQIVDLWPFQYSLPGGTLVGELSVAGACSSQEFDVGLLAGRYRGPRQRRRSAARL